MPIYEYKCTDCGESFEILARMSDDPPAACERCNSTGTLEKVLHPAQINYRGSGFYSTDYGSRSAAKDSTSTGGSGTSKGNSDSSASTSTGASGGSGSGDAN